MKKRRTSQTERAEELRLLHASGDDVWWGRPTAETVNAVWALVAPTLPTALRHLARDFTARQVLTVVLARCIQIGGEGTPSDGRKNPRRKKRRTFSQNHLFDAVALKWSRTFKMIAETGRTTLGLVPTQHATNLSHDSAIETRRQLLAAGVRLGDIWKILVASGWSNSDRSKKPGTNPFFYLTRPNPKLGYRVHLRDTEQFRALRQLLPPAPDQSQRLLLDSDPWPARVDRYQICAERPFNGVEEDKTVVRLLEIMERTRLQFHVRRFRADYDRWQRIVARVAAWKLRVPFARRKPFAFRVKWAHRLRIDLDAFRQLRVHVEGLPAVVVIKSQFFRDREGRFHARHFWPEYVGGQRVHNRRLRGIRFLRDVRFSLRASWFTDRHGRPFAGFDVASSQTQILAVLLGLTDLEILTRNPGFKVYAYLAEQALARRLPLRRQCTSAELLPVMKDLWVRILYGGHLREIVLDHFNVLVPGRFPKKWTKRYNRAVSKAEQDLRGFLESIPWYGKPGERKLSDFLRACEAMAQTAMAKDPYAGVHFTDPLAGTTVRWNPPRRGRWRMNCSGLQVALKLPGGWSGKKGTPKRRFIDAVQHAKTGDYPVSAQKLKQAVTPGVVHLLDAFFNALVILGLEQEDFIALHDCWLLPIAPGAEANRIASQRAFRATIAGAGQVWFKGLGPVYAGLVGYLEGTEFGPWMRRLQARWKRHCLESRWPDFRVEPALGMKLPSQERLIEAADRLNVSLEG